MKRVLIIGGAGFVGANLVRACLARGLRVTVVDSLEPTLRSTLDGLRGVMDRIEFVRADMRDQAAMASAVRDQNVIINCAAQTSHPISMGQPTFDADLNCVGHLSILECIRHTNPTALVIYMSSSTVVGRGVHSPIDETHPESPLDIYSANKLAGEKYYRIYHTAHGLRTMALRFANLYGPYGKGFAEFGFINYFIQLGWTDSDITLFGTGAQMRNALFVEDACEALLAAAEEPRLIGQVAFVAHDAHVSVHDIAQQIVTTFGRGRLRHVEWPEGRKRIEVDDVQISCDRFRGLVSWQPRYLIRQGLERTRDVLEQG
jgi:UDP-glucose 4-epimerase